jgi:hypothetical protein
MVTEQVYNHFQKGVELLREAVSRLTRKVAEGPEVKGIS